MRTLDHWKGRLSEIPTKIECAEMQVIRGDDAPVFIGPGSLDITSSTKISFVMHGTAPDEAEAMRALKLASENPYDATKQLRVVATDYEGTAWNCGFTEVVVSAAATGGWLLTGQINSLQTTVSGSWVSTTPGVELVFQPKLHLPTESQLVVMSSIEGSEVERKYSAGQQQIQLLNSEITFYYPPSGDGLHVTAKTSEKLQHPYLENWLSEPLRILLGQPVYPRLVARNFGDGSAHIWLRPSPPHLMDTRLVSLVCDPVSLGKKFWELYGMLLTVIAEARDSKGDPNFQANVLTQYYEEVINATQGSRWVLCMTLASVAEGLAKMLMGGDLRSDFAKDDIEGLKKLVSAWKGDKGLRDRVLNDISRAGTKSIGSFLRDLVKQTTIERENERAWTQVRHAVMHGNLVSPWGSQEEDQRLHNLADLVHRLTHEVVRQATAAAPVEAPAAVAAPKLFPAKISEEAPAQPGL